MAFLRLNILKIIKKFMPILKIWVMKIQEQLIDIIVNYQMTM